MADKKSLRLLISCGGTGGHFNPGLGIAKHLNELGGSSLLLLGGKHAPGQKITAEKQNVDAVTFTFDRPGKNPAAMIRFLFSVIRGYRTAKRLFREFRPDAVLIMGSSVSLPPALAAHWNHIPVFLHEGNAKVGKANRFLSRWADTAALSFPAVNSGSLRSASVVTGFPLRTALTDCRLTREEAFERINRTWNASFDPAKPLILVFGGSLGARNINMNFDADPADPRVKDLQVIHLAGPGRADELRTKYDAFPCASLLLESCSEMEVLYTAADAVVSRAGGSTVSEIAFFGKYALLIPYPYAAEDHQNDNARFLASAGGAEILSDRQATKEAFRSFVSRFLADVGEYRKKGRASLSLARPDAADAVLRMIADRLTILSGR